MSVQRNLASNDDEPLLSMPITVAYSHRKPAPYQPMGPSAISTSTSAFTSTPMYTDDMDVSEMDGGKETEPSQHGGYQFKR